MDIAGDFQHFLVLRVQINFHCRCFAHGSRLHYIAESCRWVSS